MNIKSLLDEIITMSFPELIGDDIQIKWAELGDALLEMGKMTSEGYFIEVDKELKGSKDELIGGLVHELCHIVSDKKMSRISSLKDRILYKASKRYKTLDERNTDLDVLVRGYSFQLLKFLEFSQKKGFDHYKEDGLSIREVKAIIKKQDQDETMENTTR